MDWLTTRFDEMRRKLDELLLCPKLPFDESLRSKLPEQGGIYAIYKRDAGQGEVLRAGRTKTAAAGLRQRIYQNHLMGNQSGNLRSQLVRDKVCTDIEEAKAWVRRSDAVLG